MNVPTANLDRAEHAKFLAGALKDFRSFCGLLDIVPKAGQRIKLRLNRIQRRYCAQRTSRDVALKPRQIGFTTLEQARDVYRFVTEPGARVVATCQSITDHAPVKLLNKNYEVMFESLERLGVALKFKTRSLTDWTLADRDASLRIVEAGASEAAAQKKGRAGTITRLHLTETAFYEYADETLNALLECVPAPELGSEIISESTPNGAFGTFFRQCQEAIAGKSGYRLHFYPWYEAEEYALPIPEGVRVEPQNDREKALLELRGVTREQLYWYQRKVRDKGSQDLVDQEYPSDPDTCFLVSGRVFFSASHVVEMLAKASEPVTTQQLRESGSLPQRVGPEEVPALRVWHLPETGRQYVVAVDTSEGTGGDAGAAIVLERGSGRHMATLWGQFRPWVLAKYAASLARKYNQALVAVERNNHGGTVLRALHAEQSYPNIFVDRDEKPGFLTSEASRGPILDTLEEAVRVEAFKTSDRFLLGEMRTFIVNERGRAEAAKGAHDDLVLATAIGWDVICRASQVARADLSGLVL